MLLNNILKNKFKNKVRFIALPAVLFLILILLVSCRLFEAEEEPEVTPGMEVEFEIKEGMSLKETASLLEEKGIVNNGFLFRLFVEQKGKEGRLIPGVYVMMTNSEYEEVLDKITSGTPVVTYKFTIPEGFTVKQIFKKVSDEIPFIEYGDMEQVKNISNYNCDYMEGASSLEGFLFPKTYEITIDYTAKDIIEMMLAQYQFETLSLDYSFTDGKGLSHYDILKIASLVEKEAYIADERALISAVIHNRLDIGMTLGIDAALCYFLDKWENDLTLTDLETDTEYNTRLYAGLPPTPICNTGLASIEAALHPADVEYLYFVVNDSEKHTHAFANTLEEHERNISETK